VFWGSVAGSRAVNRDSKTILELKTEVSPV
jgi:hypothetical protein